MDAKQAAGQLGGTFIGAIIGGLGVWALASYQSDSKAGDNAAIAAAPAVVDVTNKAKANGEDIIDLKVLAAETNGYLKALSENQDVIYNELTKSRE